MTPSTFESVFNQPTITVLQEDVLNGKKGDSRLCPIALAARRVFGDRRVDVTPAVLIVHDHDGQHWFTLPSEARKFQEEFDTAKWDDFDRLLDVDFQPLTFPLLPYDPPEKDRN